MAQSNSFRLRVIAPTGVVLDQTTSEVRLPAVDGEIGILPHFTKYAGVLGSGYLFYATSRGLEKVAVSGGLIQFVTETVAGVPTGILTVLADTVGEIQ